MNIFRFSASHNYFFQLLNFEKQESEDGAKGMRYSQWTLKYAIMMHGRSVSLYEFLREERVLSLPSRQMLYQYCGTSEGEVGISEPTRKRLHMESSALQPAARFVSLQVDEMAIRASLEYQRTRQQNVGQVDLGGLTEKEDESDGGVLANSLLNILVKGLTGPLSVLLASFPVKALDAITLKSLILYAIEESEKAGFIVLRVVGDNAKINEKLFELLRQEGDDPETP